MSITAQHMKKTIVLAFIAALSLPFLGYYEHHEEIGSIPVFFIKKEPSLQMKFFRVFHPNFEAGVNDLSAMQRQHVIDYCRYRLGIDTQLNNDEALQACWDR